MGHVIYDAPRSDEKGNPLSPEKVCIVDSAASMANHLETGLLLQSGDRSASSGFGQTPLRPLHLRPARLFRQERRNETGMVLSSLTEGHRLASDYFLDGKLGDQNFREKLRE